MTDKKDEMAVVPRGMEGMIAYERPEGTDEGILGNEGIGRDDILMPRLGLAQKMSPEVDPTAPRYIDGLQFTDLFNSVTKQNYGKGPIYFVILRRDDPRWIEFNPIDQGGGIKDRNVMLGDERTMFGANGEKPLATMFYDFIALLLTESTLTEPLQNVIALSFKSSGLKAAKHLNFLVQQRGKKSIFKGVYEMKTGSDTDKKTQGVYAVYKIKNAGWLKPDSVIEKLAAELFETWKDRETKIDDDLLHPDVEMPVAGEQVAAGVQHDKVPF